MARLAGSIGFALGVVVWGILPHTFAAPSFDDSAPSDGCVGALANGPLQYPKLPPEWIQIASSEWSELDLSEQDPWGWVVRAVHRDRQGQYWTEVLQLQNLETVGVFALGTLKSPSRLVQGQSTVQGKQVDLGRFRFRVVNHYQQKLRGVWVLERSVLQRIRLVTQGN